MGEDVGTVVPAVVDTPDVITGCDVSGGWVVTGISPEVFPLMSVTFFI